jgi:hypothetical protein
MICLIPFSIELVALHMISYHRFIPRSTQFVIYHSKLETPSNSVGKVSLNSPGIIRFHVMDCTSTQLDIKNFIEHILSKVWRAHESVFVNIFTSIREKLHSTSLSSFGCLTQRFPNVLTVTCAFFLLNVKNRFFKTISTKCAKRCLVLFHSGSSLN